MEELAGLSAISEEYKRKQDWIDVV
jgi:hypothetical protein